MNPVGIIFLCLALGLVVILCSVLWFSQNPQYRIVEKHNNWFYIQRRVNIFEWKNAGMIERTIELANTRIQREISENNAIKVKKIHEYKK